MINYLENNAGKGIPDFDDTPIQKLQAREKYIMSPALERAVNMAIFLGQPLLLTGEPGTGKTQLAHHLADLFSSEADKVDLFIFNTKSTSTAQDLFYRYDSLGHFKSTKNKKLDSDVRQFIHYQALGKAIDSGSRCIVLIDEIDKAPRDFPNDILDVMTELSFEVPELGLVGEQRVSTAAKNRPIVIMTSNSEKALPEAFLRRCVFCHIPFPSDEMLQQILVKRVSRFEEDDLKQLVAHFNEIRKQCKGKKPATAELLQWVLALEQMRDSKDFDLSQLKNPPESLLDTYSLLVKDKEDLHQLKKLSHQN